MIKDSIKKTTVVLTAIAILVCSIFSSSAYTGSFDNYSNPRPITLPANKGCGDNVVGLYVDEHMYDYSGTHTSKYKWDLLTGNSDVLSACNAVRFNVVNKVFVTTLDLTGYLHQITDQFYGYDMSVSSYHHVSSNSVTSPDQINKAQFTYQTYVRNPFDQSLITSDSYVHTIQP